MRIPVLTTQATVIICEHCGRYATKDLAWQKTNDGKEEQLVCVCGMRTWKFRKEDLDKVKPEYMVVNENG